jgi:hypothetical protein
VQALLVLPQAAPVLAAHASIQQQVRPDSIDNKQYQHMPNQRVQWPPPVHQSARS